MIKYLLRILLIILICLTGCDSEPMTEEEWALYEAKRTHEYPVVSVYQYIATQTNCFGNIIDQRLKYCFTYIDDNGQLHQIDDFEHTEYGLWKVCIGDENKYVVKDGFDTYKWLYLTDKTLKTISSK